MDHSDVVNIAIAFGSTVVVMIGWLMRQSSRITASEAKIEASRELIEINSRRSDQQMKDLAARLERSIADLVAVITRFEDRWDRERERRGY